jgi:GNAT superfamily N-acetyltransferase/MFS family permease
MTATPRRLWRDRDFATLWAGQTVSLVGSQVTAFALPLVAALSLGASAVQMGLLTAAEFAPSAALGLVAGVWIDRLPRRPVLIAADLGRAALLGTIPAAALAGVLGIGQLYAVALLAGALGLLADVGRGSLLPSLVGRAALADANGKLAMSGSVARVAGPGLSGALVQLLTAPIALAADALSFLVSAACLSRVRVVEAPAAEAGPGRGVWAEIGAGLRVVRGSPLWRAHTGATALLNFFAGTITAVEMLFFTCALGSSSSRGATTRPHRPSRSTSTPAACGPLAATSSSTGSRAATSAPSPTPSARSSTRSACSASPTGCSVDAEIRRPVAGDGQGLAEIWLDMARYHAELDPVFFRVPGRDGLAEALETWATGVGDDALVLVAERDGRVVGFVGAAVARPDADAATQLVRELTKVRLVVAALGVLRSDWRRGIGSRLLAAAEDWGREKGATVALLDTYEGSPVSVPFYLKRGYGRRALRLRKEL